jgi:hypothetical protein
MRPKTTVLTPASVSHRSLPTTLAVAANDDHEIPAAGHPSKPAIGSGDGAVYRPSRQANRIVTSLHHDIEAASMGRRPVGEQAMTAAERQQRRRDKLRDTLKAVNARIEKRRNTLARQEAC